MLHEAGRVPFCLRTCNTNSRILLILCKSILRLRQRHKTIVGYISHLSDISWRHLSNLINH